VAKTLKKGDKIQLARFGTFEVKKRAARTGVNPKTGAKIQIKSSKAPAFRFGKTFKELF
jgi:DNA-binding protein HU-beta